VALFAIATLGSTASVHAGIALSLYGTGLDQNGNLLADQAVDPHYTVQVNPPSTLGNSYTYANPPGQLQVVYNAYPGSWVPGTASSQWIGPSPNINQQFSPGWDGWYYYETTFNLPNSWVSVEIEGRWATDNSGQIWLNGQSTGIVKGVNGYNSLTAFSLTNSALLQPGLNTLQFRVWNDPLGTSFNPTGLQVQFTAAAVTTPEAGSLAIWSLLGTIGFFVAQRSQGLRHQLAA
jgi:hypothetical protein